MDVNTIIGTICGLAMIGMLVFYHIGYNNGKLSMLKEIIEDTKKEIEKAMKQKKTPKKQK